MFTRRLAEYLNTASGIAGITAYAETYPAPKVTSPQIVGVITSGGLQSPQGRTIWTYARRILVTGDARTAMSKAWEIYRHFFPAGNDVKGFDANEYTVYMAEPEEEPALVNNAGNIFTAGFVMRFITARDT